MGGVLASLDQGMISGYLRMLHCNLAPVMAVGEAALLITAFIGPQQQIGREATGRHMAT